MGKIFTAIQSQAYEIIRDRILIILMDEMDLQQQLTYDPDLELQFFLERLIAIDKEEVDSVVVSLAAGEYLNENQGSSDGNYTFYVDCYCKSKSRDGEDGFTRSNVKLQKLLGIMRFILKNPIYKTLGFTTPFIMNLTISNIDIKGMDSTDAANTSMGRLTLKIRANETTSLLDGVRVSGYDTRVYLKDGIGYFYETDNY